MINSYERPYTSARSTFNNIDEATIRQIFDIDSLRKSLFERKEEAREAGWDKMRKVYINTSSTERAELLFAEKLLATYGSALPHIRYLLNSTPPELHQQEITEQRQKLIDSMGGTLIGKHWIKCMKKPEGWTYIARFLWDEKSQCSSDDIDSFFTILDEISILTDLLECRASVYDIDFLPDISKASPNDLFSLCTERRKAEVLVAKLQELTLGKTTPKALVMPTRAAIDLGEIRRPSYEQFLAAFNLDSKDVSKSSYNNYTNTMAYDYDGEDYKRVKQIILDTLISYK